jgi:hypothetical protein
MFLTLHLNPPIEMQLSKDKKFFVMQYFITFPSDIEDSMHSTSLHLWYVGLLMFRQSVVIPLTVWL